MIDYKATLNLPKTDFPMKANLAQREPGMLAHWQKIELYQQLAADASDRPRFIVHDGPPYANARPHMGTALNKILKDTITKAKTLSGYYSPFVPGWDCHGLPIELNVEKKVGKPGVKCDVRQFRQSCRDYATKQVALQREDFQRLGVLADWQHPYLTMNFQYEADTVRALAAIVEQGHIQRGEKPVHWCTACGSALAEAEVEYKDKTSPAIDVAFAVTDPGAIKQSAGISDDLKVYLPIWTTTPWTLPANQAVAVHPQLSYALVKVTINNQLAYLIICDDLLEGVMQRYGYEAYTVCAHLTGQQLEHTQLQHPLLPRMVPVILAEHVTTEAGTGNVHTAPAHGLDDYVVSQQYGLPVDNPVDSRSCFVEGTPLVAGLHVFKANEPIIEALTKSGALLHLESITHSYPHCWRHKTPLIFRATAQWFISMDKAGLREMALTAIRKTTWFPTWGEQRITNMVKNRPDWCISRQRCWGIPIPFFIHHATGELHPQMPAIMEQVACLIEKDSVDAWFDCDPHTLLGDEAEDYIKVTDTLDVWFDSGVSHYDVLAKRPELTVPADLYLEGSDQHRGWFQSSLLTALAIREQAPFKTVLTHGYVVDGQGRKMSKSLGNTILPADVVKQFGADVLRLWVASADHSGDITVSTEILQRSADAYRRIRNTARFLLANLHDFNPNTDLVAAAEMVELDRWAVSMTQVLQDKIITAYDEYQLPTIYQMIHNFCSVDMGSFYLDIIKDRQYTAKQDCVARRSAQTAMWHILEALVRWIAPILSFTADEIWQHMPGEQRPASVFLATWYDQFPQLADVDEQQHYWQWFSAVRDEVNKVLEARRNAGDIRSALDAKVVLYGDEAIVERLQRLGEELRFALITSDAAVLPAQQSNGSAVSTAIEQLAVAVEVSDNEKCTRCWQRRQDVGADDAHPQLCSRCVVNVSGDGEKRYYA